MIKSIYKRLMEAQYRKEKQNIAYWTNVARCLQNGEKMSIPGYYYCDGSYRLRPRWTSGKDYFDMIMQSSKLKQRQKNKKLKQGWDKIYDDLKMYPITMTKLQQYEELDKRRLQETKLYNMSEQKNYILQKDLPKGIKAGTKFVPSPVSPNMWMPEGNDHTNESNCMMGKYWVEDTSFFLPEVKSDYVILSFKNKNGEDFILHTDNNYYHPMWHQNKNIKGLDVKDLLNSSHAFIYSVKRLSDDKIFSLGSHIQSAAGQNVHISEFTYDKNQIIVHYSGIVEDHLNYSGALILSEVKKYVEPKKFMFKTED